MRKVVASFYWWNSRLPLHAATQSLYMLLNIFLSVLHYLSVHWHNIYIQIKIPLKTFFKIINVFTNPMGSSESWYLIPLAISVFWSTHKKGKLAWRDFKHEHKIFTQDCTMRQKLSIIFKFIYVLGTWNICQ